MYRTLSRGSFYLRQSITTQSKPNVLRLVDLISRQQFGLPKPSLNGQLYPLFSSSRVYLSDDLNHLIKEKNNGILPGSEAEKIHESISSLIRQDKIVTAHETLINFHNLNKDIHPSSFEIVLEAYKRKGDWNGSFILVEEMAREGLQITPSMFHTAITSCLYSKAARCAINLCKIAQSKNVVLAESTLLSVLDMVRFSSQKYNGNLKEDLFWLLDEMKRSGQFLNLSVYTKALRVLASICDAEGVTELIDIVESSGLAMDNVWYSSVIQAMTQVGNGTKTQEKVLSWMEKEKTEPNITIFNFLIWSAAERNSVDEAIELLEQLKVAGLTPTAVTYTTIMASCVGAKRWNEVPYYFREMLSNGIEPDFPSVMPLLQTAHNSNDNAAVELFLEVVKNHSVTLDNQGFTSSVKLFVSLQKDDVALSLIKSAASSNIDVSLNILSRSETKETVERLAKLYFYILPDHNILPSSIFITRLSALCSPRLLNLPEILLDARNFITGNRLSTQHIDDLTVKSIIRSLLHFDMQREALKTINDIATVYGVHTRSPVENPEASIEKNMDGVWVFSGKAVNEIMDAIAHEQKSHFASQLLQLLKDNNWGLTHNSVVSIVRALTQNTRFASADHEEKPSFQATEADKYLFSESLSIVNHIQNQGYVIVPGTISLLFHSCRDKEDLDAVLNLTKNTINKGMIPDPLLLWDMACRCWVHGASLEGLEMLKYISARGKKITAASLGWMCMSLLRDGQYTKIEEEWDQANPKMRSHPFMLTAILQTKTNLKKWTDVRSIIESVIPMLEEQCNTDISQRLVDARRSKLGGGSNQFSEVEVEDMIGNDWSKRKNKTILDSVMRDELDQALRSTHAWICLCNAAIKTSTEANINEYILKILPLAEKLYENMNVYWSRYKQRRDHQRSTLNIDRINFAKPNTIPPISTMYNHAIQSFVNVGNTDLCFKILIRAIKNGYKMNAVSAMLVCKSIRLNLEKSPDVRQEMQDKMDKLLDLWIENNLEIDVMLGANIVRTYIQLEQLDKSLNALRRIYGHLENERNRDGTINSILKMMIKENSNNEATKNAFLSLLQEWDLGMNNTRSRNRFQHAGNLYRSKKRF